MRARIAATVAALAVLAAGCGSPTPNTTAPEPASPPPSSTPAEASSAPASESAQPASGELSVEEFLARFSGAYEKVKTYSMDMTVESSDAGPVTASGVVDQSGGFIAQHMKMSVMEQKIELIQLKDAVYMLVPDLSKDWVRMTPNQAAASGIEMPTDPAAVLNDSKDNFEKVEFVGVEDVKGTRTDHYRVTMVPEEVEDDLGVGMPVYDVWLDDIGFTRKVLVDITAEGSGTRMEIVTDKVNEPVTIKAPESWIDMPA